MEATNDAAGSDELSRLNARIAIECDPEIVRTLERRRQRLQNAMESERNNPELAAIMQHSAARAVLSIATPLPDENFRLSGPVSTAQVTALARKSSGAAPTCITVRAPHLFRFKLYGIFVFSPFFFFDIFFFFFLAFGRCCSVRRQASVHENNSIEHHMMLIDGDDVE
jgi:hypothetical protein